MNSMNIHTCILRYSTSTVIDTTTIHMDTMKWMVPIHMSTNTPPRSMRMITCPIFITGTGMRNDTRYGKNEELELE